MGNPWGGALGTVQGPLGSVAFSEPIFMGTALEAGHLDGAGAWEGAKQASLWTGGCISPCHLSAGLGPSSLLSPSSRGEAASVFDVRGT